MSLNNPHFRYKNQTSRERTLTIHLISIEKTIKALVLIVVGFKLLTLVGLDVHAWAADFVTRNGIDIGNRYVKAALERLVGITNSQIVFWSVIALVYSGVLLVEAGGLWLQKRWAEYLTVVSTALLLPLEIYEIYERFTWVRIAILVINIFIVWYLATRLRDEKTEPIRPVTPRVKICGITNIEDAEDAVKAGADEIGFNFYQNSPRFITAEAARIIADCLPSSAVKVGVFVNESKEKICEIVEFVGLDAIQLHGDETNEFIKNLRLATDKFVIKAARLKAGTALADSIEMKADAILLDSFAEDKFGGTGKKFDWKLADKASIFPCCVYVSGGLTPENVADAVRLFTPYAVDVASGVESSPGKKNRKKVEQFIRNAKEAL